jgi:hypothetical protein
MLMPDNSTPPFASDCIDMAAGPGLLRRKSKISHMIAAIQMVLKTTQTFP